MVRFFVSLSKILILINLNACLNQSNSDKEELYLNFENYLVYKVYDNEILIEQSIMDLDSIKNGVSMLYYSDGGLMIKSFYKNGLKDSTETGFYNSGEIEYQRIYDNGKAWGEHYLFYDNLKDIYFTEYGGDTIRIEDPLVKEYIYYGLDEEMAFHSKYDTLSNLIFQQGRTVAEVRIFHEKLQKRDTLKAQYYLINPPYLNKDFKVRILKDGELVFNDDVAINPKYNAVFFDYYLKEDGIYELEGIFRLTDDTNSIIRIDTTQHPIEVFDSGKVII